MKKLGFSSLLVCGALGVGAVGCSSEYEVGFDPESSPPGFVDMDRDGIVIEEGLAVAAMVQPIEDDELMDEDTRVSIQVLDASILDVAEAEVSAGLVDEDQNSDWAFAFMAASVGSTTIRFHLEYDGEINVVELPVTVIAPPEDN